MIGPRPRSGVPFDSCQAFLDYLPTAHHSYAFQTTVVEDRKSTKSKDIFKCFFPANGFHKLFPASTGERKREKARSLRVD